MNFDELKADWNSPRNNLPTAQQHELAQRFARQMIRRRRFQAIWLANTFVWLAMITVLAIWNIAVGKMKPAQEWGLFPLLLVPWAFAFHLLRHFRKPVPAAGGELPMLDTFRAALAANRANQSQLKLVGMLHAILVPLLALAVRQLHLAGKMSAKESTSMAIFFGATLLLCGAGIAAQYFRRLLLRQRQLDRLVAEGSQISA